jgi:hypothetical protein
MHVSYTPLVLTFEDHSTWPGVLENTPRLTCHLVFVLKRLGLALGEETFGL